MVPEVRHHHWNRPREMKLELVRVALERREEKEEILDFGEDRWGSMGGQQ